jgi:hypothetical protein
MVVVAFKTTGRTPLAMAAQRRRAAGFDGPHGLGLSGPQAMAAAVVLAVLLEDVRQFDRRVLSARCRTAGCANR